MIGKSNLRQSGLRIHLNLTSQDMTLEKRCCVVLQNIIEGVIVCQSVRLSICGD